MKELTYEERAAYACDVCGNVPDEIGCLEHGRGCFVVDADGGGLSFVVFDEEDAENAAGKAAGPAELTGKD